MNVQMFPYAHEPALIVQLLYANSQIKETVAFHESITI